MDNIPIAAIEQAKRETASKQAQRLVDYLVRHPGALTPEVARECAIGNISGAAQKIRPALEKRGLTIVAKRPEQRPVNRFGELSDSHAWSVQALS